VSAQLRKVARIILALAIVASVLLRIVNRHRGGVILEANQTPSSAASEVDAANRGRDTTYVGHRLAVTNGKVDTAPPLVILGESGPAGPLASSPIAFPADGRVTALEFYGADYDFTLYAVHYLEGPRTNCRIFLVQAAQHFSGTAPSLGVQCLTVTNFEVLCGDLLAFAGVGPCCSTNSEGALPGDAVYGDALQPPGFDRDTATAPQGHGTIFSVGKDPDSHASYLYREPTFSQTCTYAIRVRFEAYLPGPSMTYPNGTGTRP
jgi:hypothetical protein